MKGISPLVATVIVLAFTIAVAGIVGTFLTSFTTTQTGSVGGTGAGLTSCANSALQIKTAKVYCAGTKHLNVTVSYVTGKFSIANLTITVSSGGVTYRNNSRAELTAGDLYQFSFTDMATLSSSLSCPFAAIRVFGTCLNSTTIQVDCNKGDACYTEVFS